MCGELGALTVREYHPRRERVTVRGVLIGIVCGHSGKVWTLPAAPQAA